MDEADIQVRHEFNHTTAITHSEQDISPSELNMAQAQGPLDALHGAFITGQFSDLTISCGDQTFKTHQIMVCTQSRVFAALCAENKFFGVIDLKTYNLGAVKNMIEYFYTGGYNTIDVSPTYSLDTHTRVYGLASDYQIEGLLILSATKFAAALNKVSDLKVYFQSVRDVYSHPQAHGNELLLPSDAPDDIFTATHLRAEVVDAALIELSKIVSSPPVLLHFQEICVEVPQFHADFLCMLAQIKVDAENGEDLQPLCDKCGLMDKGYEIKVRCKGCGKDCLHSFN